MPIPSISLLTKPFEWITIPTGEVTIVSILSKEGRTASYIPVGTTQSFAVAPFHIAKYPVTNAQFAAFVDAGGYAQRRWWTESGWQEKVKQGWIAPQFWNQAKWNQSDYPVVGVSWYEAVAFTKWLCEATGEAICLPTEQQWQFAAQGATNARFAWGVDADDPADRCNWNIDSEGNERDGTTPVTLFEGKGDSPFGITDMNGNVWEWCSTGWYTGVNDLVGDEVRISRGGGWVMFYSYEVNIGNLDRMCLRPYHRLNYIGFRIIRNVLD